MVRPALPERGAFFAELIPGKPWAYDDIPESTSKRKGSGADSSSGSGKRDDFVIDGFDLVKWAARKGKGFAVYDFLKAYAPGYLRREANQDRCAVECPFEEEAHSKADPKDRGAWVVNGASDEAKSEEGGFVWGCKHNGCSHRKDRLLFIKQALRKGWFSVQALDDEQFYVLDDNGDQSGGTTETEKPSFDDLIKEATAFTASTPGAALDAWAAKVAAAGLGPGEQQDLRAGVMASTGKKKGEVEEIFKQASRKRAKQENEWEAKAKRSANKTAGTPGALPCVNYDDEGFDPTLKIVWAAIHSNNASEDGPKRFNFLDKMAKITRSSATGTVRGEVLNYLHLRNDLNAIVKFVKTVKRGDDDYIDVSQSPPRDVVEDVSVQPENGLPILRGVVRMPFFTRRDGKAVLVSTPGYDAVSGYFLDPIPGFDMLKVPLAPTEQQVADAKASLDAIYGSFPFRDSTGGAASWANFMALQLHFFMRDLIPGHTPYYLATKPTPGTGATLMLDQAIYIGTGAEPVLTPEISNNEEEQRKSTATNILSGATYTYVDNVKNKVDSATLAGAATAHTISTRILGETRNAEAKVNLIKIIAGNNVTMSGEMGRRMAPIRLDAQTREPDKRDLPESAIQPLHPYVLANHAQLAFACLVLIQNWIALGEPAWGGKPLASFEGWSSVMGGVVETSGWPKFMGNRDIIDNIVNVTDDMSSFLLLWLAADGLDRKRAINRGKTGGADLFDIIEDNGLDLKLPEDDKRRLMRLGQRLSERVDNVVEAERGIVFRSQRNAANTTEYWFERRKECNVFDFPSGQARSA